MLGSVCVHYSCILQTYRMSLCPQALGGPTAGLNLPYTCLRGGWFKLCGSSSNFVHNSCFSCHLPSESKWLQAGKNDCRIIFGGSTGKSCKSPGGYYITKFLGNYSSHPVRAPFLRNLWDCGSGTETGGGGSYRTGALTGKNYFRIIFGGST